MNIVLALYLFIFTYKVIAQQIQCGFMCSQCDLLGNCLQCQQGFLLNKQTGLCQSQCSENSYYLDQNTQKCQPLCNYGYYESDDYFVCLQSQKCPAIKEIGNNQKQIISATLVAQQFVVFCLTNNTVSNIQSYFLRIYDTNLQFKGEVQQLSDYVQKYYFDAANNIFITASQTQLNFWDVQSWKILRTDLFSNYALSTKYVVYLDQDYLILQDQSEQLFTIFTITQASSNSNSLQINQFSQTTQQGQMQIYRGINSIFFTSYQQQGFFQIQINRQNNTISQINQYCNTSTIISNIAPVHDKLVLFGDNNTNLGVWRGDSSCQIQNISSQFPLQTLKIIDIGSLNSPLYFIAAGLTQYYELQALNQTSAINILKTNNMNSTFYIDYNFQYLYIRNNMTFNISIYQNNSLVQIANGASSSPDSQNFVAINYYNQQLYEFYIYSMFINQANSQQMQAQKVQTLQQSSQISNINYYQLFSSNNVNQMAIDPNFDGQLVVASDDGSLRIYELTNIDDLSYLHILTQYHPSCLQNQYLQSCLMAKNITISDLGYYYVIYQSSTDQFISIWQRNTYSLTFISDYRFDINILSTVVNYLLQQNILLIQHSRQLKIFDISKQSLLVNETYTSSQTLYYVSYDNSLWGSQMIIYLLSDRIMIRQLTNTTAAYQVMYSSIYSTSTYYNSYLKAQYFSSTKVIAFNLYYNVLVYNFTTQKNITSYQTSTRPLKSFCYHPSNGYTLLQYTAFKDVILSNQVGTFLSDFIITGFITPFCGTTNKNIFYYYVKPLLNTAQNTVYVMTLPNYELNHVVAFNQTITFIQVDESKLILYVGFSNGDIYASQIILNFRINLGNYTNAQQFFYSQSKNYFIIFQGVNLMVVDSRSLILLKQFSTPNQKPFTAQFNEQLEIVVLFSNNTIIQWRINSGQLDQYPIQHKSPILTCQIDAINGILVSQSTDFQIIVWNIQNFAQIYNISYHIQDLKSIPNQQSQQALQFQVSQLLLLQDIHYLISSNTLNKIYIHDLVNNVYFFIQIPQTIILYQINYDFQYQYMYIIMASNEAFTDIYQWQNTTTINKAFQYKSRVIGSQDIVKLTTKFSYEWSFIYELRTLTVLSRNQLNILYVINTFNPLITDLLVAYNLRQLIFWSDCSAGQCSPKIPIFSIDTGLQLSEVPYQDKNQQGMVIRAMIDQDTNNLIIFKDQNPRIIIIYDLLNNQLSGLFNNIQNAFNYPLTNQILIKETANLIIYSNSTITSMQIEAMLNPQQQFKSILPNRVSKLKLFQNNSLYFFDSKSQSWMLNSNSSQITNIISTNPKSLNLTIKYFFITDNYFYVIYQNQIVQINSSFQIVFSQLYEVDKAIFLPSSLIAISYSGNLIQYNLTNLSQIGTIVAIQERAKFIIQIPDIQQIIIQTYQNNLYRFNYTSQVLQKWFSPSGDTLYKIYFDSSNNILFITMMSGSCYIFDKNSILLSGPSNITQNAIQLPQLNTQIFKINIEPISGMFSSFVIPPNNIPIINFYTYNFTNTTVKQLQSVTFIGQIPSFSRSSALKISFISQQIFIFSPYQIMVYNFSLSLNYTFRNSVQFKTLRKIIVANSPIPNTSLFFFQQENIISLFSYSQQKLTNIYQHSCIAPNLLNYTIVNSTNNYQINILVLCDDKIVKDFIYLQSLSQQLSQINSCFIESTSTYQYQFLQMLQDLNFSFNQEKANPSEIRIEQLTQTDFSSINMNRKITFAYRSQNINTVNTLLLKENSYKDYSYSSLRVQSFTFDMSQLTQIVQFNPIIQEVVFDQIVLDYSNLNQNSQNPFSQILFNNMDTVILNNLSLSNFDLQRQTPLLAFQNVQKVIITNLIFQNLTLECSDPTFFYFYNVQSLIIQNVSFSNVSITNSEQTQLILLEFVPNFQIQDSYFQNINSTQQTYLLQFEGVKTSSLNNITLYNSSQMSLLQSFNFYQILGVKVLVEENTVNLEEVKANNINQISSSLINLNQTYQISIQNSTFQQISCNQCTGGVMLIYQGSNHIINNVQYLYNTAQKGGALSILECPSSSILIKQSKFLNNNAGVYGGAIYLQNSNVQIESTLIQQNQAVIGGGIKYTSIKPIIDNQKRILQCDLIDYQGQLNEKQSRLLQNSQNVISKNKAQIFGNNIGSYLQNITILYPNLQYFNLSSLSSKFNPEDVSQQFVMSSYQIGNHRSGQSIDLELQILDEENNPITFDPRAVTKQSYDPEVVDMLKNIQLKIEPLYDDQLKVFGKYTADYTDFSSLSNSFKIPGMTIVTNPQTSNIVKIASSSITLFNQTSRTIDQANSNRLYSLIYVSTRACLAGEVYQIVDNVYQCYVCQRGTYFLRTPTQSDSVCLKCPSNARECEKDIIQLNEGHWRINNQTDTIISCQRNPNNCIPHEDKNYCIQGHYGPLCEQCDVYGNVWGEPYITDGNYNCYPCSDLKHKPYYTFLFINLCLMVVFILISLLSLLHFSRCIATSYYLRKLQLVSVSKSAFWNQQSFGLKTLVNFLQVTGVIYAQLEFSFPYGTRILSSTIGMPSTNLFYSLDCIFHSVKEISIIYLRTLWSLTIPIIYLIFIYLIIISYGVYRRRSVQVLLIYGASYLFFFTQNSIIFLLLSMMSCREIDGQFYIISDITYKCFTPTHLKFMKYIGIPGLIGWIFVIPLYIFHKIYKKKQDLDQVSFREKYGHLYNEYKPKFYFWDFVKSYKRLLVTAVLTLYVNPLDNKLIFGFLVQIAYIQLLSRIKPHFNVQLYKVELFTELMIAALMFAGIIVNQSAQPNESYVFYAVVIVNSCAQSFIILWIIKQFLKGYFYKLYYNLKKCLLTVFPFLIKYSSKNTFNSSIRHLLVWKKARQQLLGGNLVEFLNEQEIRKQESKMNQSSQNMILSQRTLNAPQLNQLNTNQAKLKDINLLKSYKQQHFEKQFPNQNMNFQLLKLENTIRSQVETQRNIDEGSCNLLMSSQIKQMSHQEKISQKRLSKSNRFNESERFKLHLYASKTNAQGFQTSEIQDSNDNCQSIQSPVELNDNKFNNIFSKNQRYSALQNKSILEQSDSLQMTSSAESKIDPRAIQGKAQFDEEEKCSQNYNQNGNQGDVNEFIQQSQAISKQQHVPINIEEEENQAQTNKPDQQTEEYSLLNLDRVHSMNYSKYEQTEQDQVKEQDINQRERVQQIRVLANDYIDTIESTEDYKVSNVRVPSKNCDDEVHSIQDSQLQNTKIPAKDYEEEVQSMQDCGVQNIRIPAKDYEDEVHSMQDCGLQNTRVPANNNSDEVDSIEESQIIQTKVPPNECNDEVDSIQDSKIQQVKIPANEGIDDVDSIQE
ncbi:transmembrane protein, putative (macronuclear) [Tetrahymena thermophila SB210]|uniref:Transmembrane protein, putative n=1 Tax=Tetrahymena thermophila (strain SB210) TaxID=312017 RepID=Q23WU5_TETTS|nr:transmembrane protein, putative [Tetrahymena thermophila SB210]EAS01000.2 transmembrane protein, putative [Tetrahymena thermophila SB210]|eukprot:XP_001021245.2 transmembrane protein, putative [Tetrahymena thermophila SB210]